MGRVPADASAFTDRTSPYIVNCIARTPDVKDLAPHQAWAATARDAMSAFGSGKLYVNFTGDDGVNRVKSAYAPGTYERLQRVKDRTDPQNLFRFNHNVVPTTAS
jgi:hypothetical protein